MADVLQVQARAAAFDDVAATYDSNFSRTTIGLCLREFVWSRLTPFVRPGMRALDLGCGTGEDALWLARSGCQVTAADASTAMLEQVAAKTARLNLERQVQTIQLDLNTTADPALTFAEPFDLVVSNFGAINCLDDLTLLRHKLSAWVKPDGVLALVFMGRFCAWETAYYLTRLDRRAARRWWGRAKTTVGGETISINYWSKREVVCALRPSFNPLDGCGVGTCLPPSYLFHWLERRPKLFRTLARWESRTSGVWPLSRVGDHMLVILRRAGTTRVFR